MRRYGCFRRFLGHHEEAAMPPVLHKQKHAVDGDGHDERNTIWNVERSVPAWHGVVRQDETQHGEREDHHEEGVGALEIVGLFAVAQPAEQQRETHETIEHEHDDGKHRVARERRLVRAGGHDEGHHATSSPVIVSVSSSVPAGSPSRCATTSAWRTIATAATRITPQMITNRRINSAG